jgi:hypothetical protein
MPKKFAYDTPEFRANAARRRATWTITRYTDPAQTKAAEYAYWQSQPAHVILAAAAELTAQAYAAKGIDVSRLQRVLVRTKRT